MVKSSIFYPEGGEQSFSPYAVIESHRPVRYQAAGGVAVQAEAELSFIPVLTEEPDVSMPETIAA